MSNSKINKALQTNRILLSAGTQIVKTSFQTTKSIASLYSSAGFKAFGFGKNLLKETIKIAIDNQKSLRDTSFQALKDTVEIIRDRQEATPTTEETEIEAVATEEPPVKKTTKRKKKEEVTIDSLLSEEEV